MEEEKKMEEPEIYPETFPNISPEMIKTTLRVLEASGMIYYAGKEAYVPTESGWKLLTEVEEVKEVIIAHGHPKIVATNTNILAITKLKDPQDDNAIVAVSADKACVDLSEKFRENLKKARKISIKIEADGEGDNLAAYGSPALKLTDPEIIVIRKDESISGKTIAILANKSANELKQSLIEKLRDSNTIVKITLEIKP